MPVRPARTADEFRKLVADTSPENKIIRSRADWEATLINPGDAAVRSHPLHALTLDEIAEFSEELVFRNGGLAGAKVGDLPDKLSYNDFRALWAMFGIDATLVRDEQTLPPEGPHGPVDHQICMCGAGGCACAPRPGYYCSPLCGSE